MPPFPTQAKERPLLGSLGCCGRAGMVCDFSGAIKESTQLHQLLENTVSVRIPSAQDVWLGEPTTNSCVGWENSRMGWVGEVKYHLTNRRQEVQRREEFCPGVTGLSFIAP